jgi:hypothetical protein
MQPRDGIGSLQLGDSVTPRPLLLMESLHLRVRLHVLSAEASDFGDVCGVH